MLIFYSSVFLFFCFSFSGWLLETVAAAVRTHRYVDRSVLFGPLCIVYGVGGLMMVHLLGELRGNWLFLFLGCAIYATVVEWIAGHLLEAITHTRWWDYSNHRWNLDGYVSLSTSLLWGLMGLAVVQWGTPLLLFVYRLVPALVMHITLWVLLGVLAVCALLWLRVGGRPDVKRLGPYLLCALLPIAWYMALLNHSAEHAFFTYRALCVTIFAAVSMAIPTGKAET